MPRLAHRTPARVLVVDDEAQVCALVADTLEAEGYEVVCATNDADAYEVLKREAPSLSMLIADINLGRGTTGFDVARFARRIAPNLAVLYVSGDGVPVLSRHGVDGGELLPKPFSPAELVDRLPGKTG